MERILQALYAQIDKARLLEKLNQLNIYCINKNQRLAEFNRFFQKALEQDDLDVNELQPIYTSLKLAMDLQNQAFAELKMKIEEVMRK